MRSTLCPGGGAVQHVTPQYEARPPSLWAALGWRRRGLALVVAPGLGSGQLAAPLSSRDPADPEPRSLVPAASVPAATASALASEGVTTWRLCS
ncbi:unnamed protein product [Caretta caretta]